MTKEEILEYFKDINHAYNDCTKYDTLKRMIDELQEPKTGRWIPLTKRPMTDEERKYYMECSDIEEAMIFDGLLPEDGEEVLVSYGGYVSVDTFYNDDGGYFEGVDINGVQAWIPLPEPYNAESEVKYGGTT